MPHNGRSSTRNLGRMVAPALWGVRAHWGTGVLLAATAATALATLLPITSLASWGGTGLTTRLRLPPWRGGDLGMDWRTLAWSPTEARSAALVMLFQLLLGVAIGVLAVAGLTIVSLSAARASARASEVSVRRAVGASRRHVLWGALLEGGIVAAGALLLGGVAGTAAARSAMAAWPGGLHDGTAVASLLGVAATLAGIVLGSALPVAFPKRRSALPSSGGKPLQLIVPALQLGMSLTVLTGAALLERRAGPLLAPSEQPVAAGEVFQVTGPGLRPPARAARYASVLNALAGRRTFDLVSLSSPGTLVGMGMVDVVITDCGLCVEGGLPFPLHPVPAVHHLVSADTFRVLELPVVAGRGITAADRWNAPRVAVVNRSLASRHFQRGEAVGRKILVGGVRADWYTVVGVVEDQRPVGFGAGLQPPFAVYLSVLQHPAPAVDLYVRRRSDAERDALANRAVRDVFGMAAAAQVSTARLLADEASPVRWFGRMLGIEGWAALAVATLGTFVVMRLWVASLAYELGLRRAVGARRRDVLGFVILRALGVAGGGVGIGLWLGLLVSGTLATIVAGLPPWDVQLALRIAPLLVAATLVGALWPAWQAAGAPPSELLEATSA